MDVSAPGSRLPRGVIGNTADFGSAIQGSSPCGVVFSGVREEFGLLGVAAAEGGCGERRQGGIEAVAAGADFKDFGDVVGDDAFSAHAGLEMGVVEMAVAGFADAVEDFIFFTGAMAVEPGGEEVFYAVREPDHGVESGDGAVVGGGFEDGGGFVIVEAGDAWGEGDADGDACVGEGANGFEAGGGGGGAGFEGGGEMAVEGGDGDEDGGGLPAGEVAEEVEVPGDEVVFGNDGNGVAEMSEDFEAAPGDLELSLDGLVRVGDAAADEGFGLPGGTVEFAGQEVGGIFFDHQAGFEVQARVESEVFVIGAGVAVGATVLATPVGIEACFHGDVGAGVGGDD